MAIASAFTVFTLLPTAAASADPSANDWYTVRMCESSNNYAINTGNGYFGAYQFNQATWDSVGGKGRPDQNSPAEQDYRALYLYRTRGWQPWTCGAGLRWDDDAADGRVPTYAQSAYMGGSGKPGPPVSTPPPTVTRPSTVTPPTGVPLPTKPPPVPQPALPPVSTPPPTVTRPPTVTPPTGVPLPTKPPPVPQPALPPLPTIPPITWSIPPAGSGVLVEPAIPLLTVTSGACSPVLTIWQEQMNHYGYSLNGSGCNDSATSSAARKLQYANGIRTTTDIGPLTLIAAYLGRPPR